MHKYFIAPPHGGGAIAAPMQNSILKIGRTVNFTFGAWHPHLAACQALTTLVIATAGSAGLIYLDR